MSTESREFWDMVEGDRQPRAKFPTEPELERIYEMRDLKAANERARRDFRQRHNEEQYRDRS